MKTKLSLYISGRSEFAHFSLPKQSYRNSLHFTEEIGLFYAYGHEWIYPIHADISISNPYYVLSVGRIWIRYGHIHRSPYAGLKTGDNASVQEKLVSVAFTRIANIDHRDHAPSALRLRRNQTSQE